MAVRLSAAYCAPVFCLNFQAGHSAKLAEQPQTEVGYRMSDFRGSQRGQPRETRGQRRPHALRALLMPWPASRALHTLRALPAERLRYVCLFTFAFLLLPCSLTPLCALCALRGEVILLLPFLLLPSPAGRFPAVKRCYFTK